MSKGSIDCVALINDEHMVSGADDSKKAPIIKFINELITNLEFNSRQCLENFFETIELIIFLIKKILFNIQQHLSNMPDEVGHHLDH
ncbi:unnamed protein product [Rotaria sordida]|uniref:Uncharacterized protein n=1 Tax=Rotaria sordida TaxID=392033 RepID=A0A819UHY2_9BILA|nr:unnamed protein product [Rotaria sordida]